jgi:hypothetical protein
VHLSGTRGSRKGVSKEKTALILERKLRKKRKREKAKWGKGIQHRNEQMLVGNEGFFISLRRNALISCR